MPESTKSKILLSIFEGVVLAGLAFFFSNYINNISKSQDIKWEQKKTECLNPPTCDVGKLIFYVYRLGDSKKTSS